MNNETAQATEQMNNASDTQIVGSGIGQTTSHIDLNAGKKDYTQEKTQEYKKIGEIMKEPEKQYTQGEREQQIYNDNQEIERLQQVLDYYKDTPEWQDILHPNQMFKNTNIEKDYANTIKNYMKNGMSKREAATKTYNDIIKDLRNKVYDTKTNPDHDLRTDEQRREDTAKQREAIDAKAAGMNPMQISYGSGGSGGGGGSSSDKEDEERRKRKRAKEEAEARKREAANQAIQRTLQMIAGGGTTIAAANIMGNVKGQNETIKNQNTQIKDLTYKEKLARETLIGNLEDQKKNYIRK